MPDTWQTPRVWVVGEKVTASKKNDESMDLRVLFPYTAAGDLAYADSAVTLARLAAPAMLSLLQHNGAVPSYLAKGDSLKFLRVNSAGNGFEWASGGMVLGFASSSTNTQSTSTAGVDIPSLTLDLVIPQTSTVILFLWSSVNASVGDTPTQAAVLLGVIGATSQLITDPGMPYSYVQAWNPIANGFRLTGIAPATVTCKAKIATTDSSRRADAKGGRILAVAIPE